MPARSKLLLAIVGFVAVGLAIGIAAGEFHSPYLMPVFFGGSSWVRC
jgi:hypothetical protein